MSTARPTDLMKVLAEAARLAQRAPSLFDTQPWHWRVGPDLLELSADPDLRVGAVDPDGRLLTLSCGAALHHARLGLAVAGRAVTVDRLPDPDHPLVLAWIRVHGRRIPEDRLRRMRAAVPDRRTDGRAFAATPVPEPALAGLVAAAQAEETGLHLVRPDQLPMLAIATAQAATAERDDAGYQAALAEWTGRPPGDPEGVPADPAVRRGPRRVAVRDFSAAGAELEIGPGDDRGATYAVLYSAEDAAPQWLRAGEAMSAVLLTAAADGLAATPVSDVVEVPHSRDLVRGLLPGGGWPHLVLRFGLRAGAEPPPPAPRRPPGRVIPFD